MRNIEYKQNFFNSTIKWNTSRIALLKAIYIASSVICVVLIFSLSYHNTVHTIYITIYPVGDSYADFCIMGILLSLFTRKTGINVTFNNLFFVWIINKYMDG